MTQPRRDKIGRREARKGRLARSVEETPPPGRRAHLAEGTVTRPYVYGASVPADRPDTPQGEPADRESAVLAEHARRAVRVRELQKIDRPLTVGELLPGLWVTRTIHQGHGTTSYSRTGLIARSRSGAGPNVLWYLNDLGLPDSATLSVPPWKSDDSAPLYETRPADPQSIPLGVRQQIKRFAKSARFNAETRRWELPT